MKIRNDDDLVAAFATLPSFDVQMESQARNHLDNLTKPQGSLGRLEDIAAWTAGWQRSLKPSAEKAYTLIFAGNHGVTKQGVSAFPSEVTVQMVANFAHGGAAINQLCKAVPSTLRVISLSLETPTQDFTTAPAMTAQECAQAFETGMCSVPDDAEILVLGEMGIGNTTAAAAVACAVGGGAASQWVGSGTGITSEALAHKRQVVDKAIALHREHLNGALSILQHVGGRELAAIAGAVWRARELRVPVILDGYVVTAAAASLLRVDVDMLSHCIAGHLSVEPGHQRLLDVLKMKPLLDLGMRLGEGSGAQVALAIVRAALATYNNMATFAQASVASKQDESPQTIADVA
jgi:nicotinate-nucleotide--dimethylbenzimidazole phosphoribosyltransferase